MCDFFRGKMFTLVVEILSWLFLLTGIISWYMEEGMPWIGSLILLFLSISLINSSHYPEFTRKTSILPCTNGNEGYRIAMILKYISMGFALVGLGIFLYFWNKWEALVNNIITRNETTQANITQNLNCNDCLPFTWYWIFFFVASIIFIVKGFVLFTVLMQCGAVQWSDSSKENNKIKLFREVVHDVILGGIWLDLSLRFEDLVDDNNDKAWRGLFSSMVCIHLIYILSKVWDEPKYKIDFKENGMRCWYWKTIPLWFAIFKLTNYALLYTSLIYRIHNDVMIIKMGIQIEFFIMSIVSIVIIISLRVFENTSFYENITMPWGNNIPKNNTTRLKDSGGRLKF